MKKAERIYTGHLNIDTSTNTIGVIDWRKLVKGEGMPAEKNKPIFEVKNGLFVKKISEAQLQSDCVKWFKSLNSLKILFAIPNGGSRNPIEGANLKKQGVLAGVADLFLMYGNNEYYGFFIEMKLPKKKQSKEQIEFENYCKLNKYKYKLIFTFNDFRNEILNYLKN